jgi:hypothetical protein
MTARLIAAVETALSRLAQEVHHDASVLVQYAAGDWAELKAALGEAKGEAPTPEAEPKVAAAPAGPVLPLDAPAEAVATPVVSETPTQEPTP